MNNLISKYGSKIILFTIFVDELTPKEYKDLEYLEKMVKLNLDLDDLRIKTHMEI